MNLQLDVPESLRLAKIHWEHQARLAAGDSAAWDDLDPAEQAAVGAGTLAVAEAVLAVEAEDEPEPAGPVFVISSHGGHHTYESAFFGQAGGVLLVTRPGDVNPCALFAPGCWEHAAEADAELERISWYRQRLAVAEEALSRVSALSSGDAATIARLALQEMTGEVASL